MSHILEVGELLTATKFNITPAYTDAVNFSAIRGNVSNKQWVTERQLDNQFHKFGSLDVVLIRTLLELSLITPGIYIYTAAAVEVMPIAISINEKTGSTVCAQLYRITANINNVNDHFILMVSDTYGEDSIHEFRFAHISGVVAEFIAKNIYDEVKNEYREYLKLITSMDFVESFQAGLMSAKESHIKEYMLNFDEFEICVELNRLANGEVYPKNIFMERKNAD